MPTKKHLTKVVDNTGAASSEPPSKPFRIKKSVFHANEDGTSETRVIVITYHPDSGSFETPLPAYLHMAANGNTIIAEETALGVTTRYEAICEEYSRKRLSMNSGSRLLWVGSQPSVGDFAKDVFGISTLVGLGMQTVMRYTDSKHGEVIVRVDTDGTPCGETLPLSMVSPILIPDTPANRAKVQSLIDSIVQAAAVIEQARSAADPEAYIQAINDRWAAPAVVAQPPAVKPDDDEEL